MESDLGTPQSKDCEAICALPTWHKSRGSTRNMHEFKKFPSIEQFRDVIVNVKRNSEGSVLPLPELKFRGTVKLHGTNAAVNVFNPGNGLPLELSYQSRERFLTLTSDNAGFCLFATQKEQVFKDLANMLSGEFDRLTIYGEWCGGNIQKGVGINQCEKMFVIFSIVQEYRGTERTFSQDELSEIASDTKLTEWANLHKIYFVHQFETYEIDVDFANPQLSQNKLAELTTAVEEHCPVAAYFGKDGIGEGIVWVHDYDGGRLVFKVKGEKHSASKVKTLAAVNVEEIAKIDEAVDYVMTENRLNQMFDDMAVELGTTPTIKDTGMFIGRCMKDAAKEEMTTLVENGIEWKKFAKRATSKVSQFYLQKLNTLAGVSDGQSE